jgi:hypothetical protein
MSNYKDQLSNGLQSTNDNSTGLSENKMYKYLTFDIGAFGIDFEFGF